MRVRLPAHLVEWQKTRLRKADINESGLQIAVDGKHTTPPDLAHLPPGYVTIAFNPEINQVPVPHQPSPRFTGPAIGDKGCVSFHGQISTPDASNSPAVSGKERPTTFE